MSQSSPLLETQSVSKRFGNVVALTDVSIALHPAEVLCVLGDNGAGKSTLIKILSGVHRPDSGTYRIGGAEAIISSPADPLSRGIATVYQDLPMIPLRSISRNFFLWREPTRGIGPFRVFDVPRAQRVAGEELAKMTITLRDGAQPLGTLPGVEGHA